MNFLEAMAKIQDGKAVTRMDWNDPSIHCRLTHTSHPMPVLAIFRGEKGGDRYHDWVISEEDLLGEWQETAVVPVDSIPATSRLVTPAGGLLLARQNSSPVPIKKN